MQEACSLILRRRVNWHTNPPIGCGTSDRASLTGMDVPSIYSRYRGVDGELIWPENLRDLLMTFGACSDPTSELDEIVRRCAQWGQSEFVDLLYCNWRAPEPPLLDSISSRFPLIGFDVAMAITPLTRFAFSGVFQDILFGSHHELAGLASRLNHYLLFDKVEDVREFIHVREELAMTGADLEPSADDMELFPVGIHTYDGFLSNSGPSPDSGS